MKYQLVLQFPENIMSFEAIDRLESMIASLQSDVAVDGHDIGESEVNFFVFTDDPQGIFKKIMGLLKEEYRKCLKAAYRTKTGEEYIILWPKNLREFQVR